MSNLKAASLTASLLAPKGGASPAGFIPPRYGLSPDAGADTAPEPGHRRHGKEEDGTRLSLRVDDTRHRRMQLAAAHLRQSGTGLVIAALDHYLDRVVPTLIEGQCACLKDGRVPPGGCAAMAYGRSQSSKPAASPDHTP